MSAPPGSRPGIWQPVITQCGLWLARRLFPVWSIKFVDLRQISDKLAHLSGVFRVLDKSPLESDYDSLAVERASDEKAGERRVKFADECGGLVDSVVHFGSLCLCSDDLTIRVALD